MKEKFVARIEDKTRDLNRLLDHQDALKKELNNTALEIERMIAKIVELKELLEEFGSIEEQEKSAKA